MITDFAVLESAERSDKLLKKAEFPNDTKQICLLRKLP